MFLANLEEVNRLVFSPELLQDIISLTNTLSAQGIPKQVVPLKYQLRVLLSLYCLYMVKKEYVGKSITLLELITE